jgi:DNA-binding transcriptional MocR family regulator
MKLEQEFKVEFIRKGQTWNHASMRVIQYHDLNRQLEQILYEEDTEQVRMTVKDRGIHMWLQFTKEPVWEKWECALIANDSPVAQLFYIKDIPLMIKLLLEE